MDHALREALHWLMVGFAFGVGFHLAGWISGKLLK